MGLGVVHGVHDGEGDDATEIAKLNVPNPKH